MPLYEYEAFCSNGKKISSIIDAESIESAKKNIYGKRLLITKIVPVKNKGFPLITKEKKLLLFQDLSRLLFAGIALYESLVILREKYTSNLQRIVADICDQIKQGSALSDSLNRHKKNFDLLYLSMIKNAEKSGNLPQVMQEIADHLAKRLALQKKLSSILMYPLLLLGFCFIVVITLLYYVVPSLKPLFIGRELHFSTNLVLAISDFFVQKKNYLLLFLIFLISLFISAVFSANLKKRVFDRFQSIFCKKLFLQLAFIRIASTMATLLEAGVPLYDALKLAHETNQHPVFSKILEKACVKVSEGKKLSEALLLPSIFSQALTMISIAEESGNLSRMFYHISQIYQEEVDKFFLRLTTLLQPILLLLLGIIVAFVVLSILLPLTDVNSFMDF